MKFLVHSLNFSPEMTGIGKYSGELVDWLTKQGHEVRVVCAPPHYPAWKVDASFRGRLFRREAFGGASLWRAPLWIPHQPQGWRRVLHLLSFAFTSAPLMLRQALWRPDVVLTVAPALVCAPVGLLTARLCKATAWLHVQDFEVDVAFGMGHFQGGWFKQRVLSAEAALMTRFDVVSSISHRMVERLAGKGVLPERTVLFPNWVDVQAIRPLRRPSAYREELRIPPDTKVVLFSGTLGNKQGLEVLPRAAALLRHRPDILFVIAGEGVVRSSLVAAAEGLPNVRFLPLQPQARLCEFLGLADIHVLPQSAGAEDLVLPSKLTGMLSSGRPVVATCSPRSEMGRVLAQCGRVVPSGDAVALASTVMALADDAHSRATLGRCARQYAENALSINAILSAFTARASGLLHAGGAGQAAFAVTDRDVAHLND